MVLILPFIPSVRPFENLVRTYSRMPSIRFSTVRAAFSKCLSPEAVASVIHGRPPGDPHQSRHCGLAALLSQVCDTFFERRCEETPRRCPGNGFRLHLLAGRTPDTTDRVPHPDLHPRHVQVAPNSPTSVVNTACLRAAAAATRDLLARGHLDHDALVVENEAPYEEALERENDSE